MVKSVYIESSVLSYLASRRSRDMFVAVRQAITADWWEQERSRFMVRVSQLVKREISKGDPLAAKRRLAFIDDIPILTVTRSAI